MGMFNVISMFVIVVAGIATGLYLTLKCDDSGNQKLIRTGEARYLLVHKKW